MPRASGATAAGLKLAGVVLVGALALFVAAPRRVVVSPAVVVTIGDMSGAPAEGILVLRHTAHYSVETIGTGEEIATDARGVAAFPIREMRLSRAREWISGARRLAQSVDSSIGPRSWLIVWLPGVGSDGVSLFPVRGEEQATWRCTVGVGCERVR